MTPPKVVIDHRDQMQELLEHCKREHPEVMFVLFGFRMIEVEGQPGTVSILVSNIEDKEAIREACNSILAGLADVQVIDLSDTVGGMQ